MGFTYEGNAVLSRGKSVEETLRMTETESMVSFVVGEPDADEMTEQLEIEDTFPNEDVLAEQQQPIIPGLAERRRRLR